MLVIGIDPGQAGGIAYINTDQVFDVRAYVLPTEWIDGVLAVKMPETEADLARMLQEWTKPPRFAFIEAVHSMPKQGVASSFKFGRNYGFIRGVVAALGIPFEDVTPQKWQKALGCMSKGDKNVTKAAAQRLWPDKKWTHATADAALIAEFGRRRLHETGRL